MIPEQAIVEWRREAPWDANSLVEQDLLKANEGGSFFFITAAGVEKIDELFGD